MRVLAIAAHPDDAELGCGGTLARHVIDGDEVRILIGGLGRYRDAGPVALAAARAIGIPGQPSWMQVVTPATGLPYWLPDQEFDTVPRLGIIQAVERNMNGYKPEVVYTHHAGDRNLDHRIIADAVFTACRPVPGCSVNRLLSFEVPSSTEWGSGFEPNVFVSIGGEPLSRKRAALECYASEMRDAPHPRSQGNIDSRADWRGATAGLWHAEAFMLIRDVR